MVTVILEIVALIGIVIILLIYFAEKGITLFGLVAGALLMIFGFMIMTDGIQIQSGEEIDITTFESINGTTNSTYSYVGNQTDTIEEIHLENVTVDTSESSAYVYSDIPETPFIPLDDLLGDLFILLGLYGMFHYLVEMLGEGEGRGRLNLHA